MILLTRVTIVNQPTELPSTRVESEDIIAVDAFCVATVEKYMYNGGQEGSLIHMSDGLAPLVVSEIMTDVVHMVEAAIREHNE